MYVCVCVCVCGQQLVELLLPFFKKGSKAHMQGMLSIVHDMVALYPNTSEHKKLSNHMQTLLSVLARQWYLLGSNTDRSILSGIFQVVTVFFLECVCGGWVGGEQEVTTEQRDL